MHLHFTGDVMRGEDPRMLFRRNSRAWTLSTMANLECPHPMLLLKELRHVLH